MNTLRKAIKNMPTGSTWGQPMLKQLVQLTSPAFIRQAIDIIPYHIVNLGGYVTFFSAVGNTVINHHDLITALQNKKNA